MTMNPFLRVVEALNRHDVRYVIVGGFAAVMHGNDRTTVDLDIVVDLAPEEARKPIAALLDLGMRSRVPVDPLLFADAAERGRWAREKQMMVFTMLDPKGILPDVDLFIEPPLAFGELFGRSEILELENHATRVCSLDDLIDMKRRTGRPQDALDVENLELLRSRRRAEGDSL